ncbi:MAG TPA: phosphoribosylformylglycinamidine cyclo-ligase [Deltaproteobacteria bacterium]|jgi:phosphoribosylformylglycinamidine cyclo-ligase|nr:phosphoribosylformylglycinamidine cyclo-ligase [Deltaproteobacteria bacterium]HOS27661.1 phosphoribosylformylglycinamidine cyclo-ligase [Deltaproteobacteria bacterium]HPA84644.1 phosphoribosylformylglycinamidine cyclo-ligase [Deltaproteobacteria bacterium]HPV28995.1 phosphoribosylformylglycinamidine cyclo-ligase [Deltaproteobacteria bacterium]HQM20744.1 phosphoribosylformylglycinamidine cyclo-ligase [Deltaproteobacteria bacterium]
MSLTYKEAGVDIDKQNLLIKGIKSIVKSTHGPEVIGGIGGFAGRFRLDFSTYKDPVLVSSTDGVGTKIKIALMADSHENIGVDLVGMIVNDIIVDGANPMFFLDYMAMGRLNVERGKVLVSGMARGCKEAGCALIGGETAEMPGIYRDDEYDLAGFGVGIVDSDKIIDGSRISAKDILIGLHSSGVHSNGYSLVRKVLFDQEKLDIDAYIEDLGKTLAEELLTPTRIYVKSVMNILRSFEIRGIVHITGGGFIDNIPRVLPGRCCAVIRQGSWPVLPIFSFMQDLGRIEDFEMYRTFNMGIGMVLVVAEKDADDLMLRLKGLKEPASVIGYVRSLKKGEERVVFEQ